MTAGDLMAVRHNKWREAGGRCEVCRKPTPLHLGQLAHRIPQRKWCVKKWGADVIHHPLNLAWTCSLECNAAVSIGGWPVRCAELVEEIRSAMDDRPTSD